MTAWRHSQEAADFIATAESRETSPEIMEAIAFFARDRPEADALWRGECFGVACDRLDIWERVTKNGKVPAETFFWWRP